MHRQCFENILYLRKRIENSALKTQISTVDYKNHTVDFVNYTVDYTINSADLSFQCTIFDSALHRYFLFYSQIQLAKLELIKVGLEFLHSNTLSFIAFCIIKGCTTCISCIIVLCNRYHIYQILLCSAILSR